MCTHHDLQLACQCKLHFEIYEHLLSLCNLIQDFKRIRSFHIKRVMQILTFPLFLL